MKGVLGNVILGWTKTNIVNIRLNLDNVIIDALI